MKSLLVIFVTLITTASCQIHTKLHADGYHYDRPQNRLNIPEALPSCLNGAEKEKCTNAPTPLISGEGSNTNSVKRNAPDTKFAPPQTPPPLPDFLPKINFPSVLPVKLTSDAPSTEKAQSFNPHEIPPLPDFIPKINLPKIIPIKPTAAPVTQKSLPVAPQTPPPLPAFIPKINLPSVIPVKPTEAPVTQKSLPVAPQTPPPLPAFIPKINLPSVIPVKPTNSPQVKRPIPPFPPIINLPSIIPIKTTQATTRVVPTTQAPIAPILEVSKPAPFTARVQANNEYLPPVEDQEDEWEEWKKKYNKRYASQEEDERRRAIFYENVNIINLHNADYAAGRVTFDMDKNKFCDLTQEEFVKIHTGIRGKRKSSHQGYNYPVPSGESFISREIGGHEGHVSFTSQDGSSKSSISYQASKDGSSISVQSSSSSLPVSPKSSSLPVSPKSSSLPVSPKEFTSDSLQGQNMTNVFMPSPMLEDQTEDEVDWRKKGAVTPVKNQGKCASCWAFAANGALEAQNFLRKGTGPIPLSEQNLIDCVRDNDGCDGGYMTNAYEYVRRNRGVDTESSYPYEERDGQQCRFKRSDVGGECTSFMEIQEGNEEALRQAVATVGPVAAGIDGAKRSFQFYKSGYYYEPKCEQDVNHAVLIVGYGKTDKGEEYWIGKNSWDTDWGEAGYIRMAKNRGNHCGITNLASYPLV